MSEGKGTSMPVEMVQEHPTVITRKSMRGTRIYIHYKANDGWDYPPSIFAHSSNSPDDGCSDCVWMVPGMWWDGVEERQAEKLAGMLSKGALEACTEACEKDPSNASLYLGRLASYKPFLEPGEATEDEKAKERT